MGVVNLLKKSMFIGIAVAACSFVLRAPSASALSGSEYQAGRIIDDKIFFDKDALTVGQIQNFLEAKVPVCDTDGSEPHGNTTRAAYGRSRGEPPPYTCLRDYKRDIPNRAPEDSLCSGLTAADNQTAARIIYKVAKSCGVSSKVLLVLLQKEQTLVTDDWPWDNQYRSATGFGCPDSAPCNSQYYGFFNQVYHAARIYKYYAKYPNDFNHIAGRDNMILYHPNAGACGGSNVFIRNQATAGLYNYTPYQPNAAALNNLNGLGNSCSSYGNRNFWRLFRTWFGSTLHALNYRLIECDGGTKYLVERYRPTKRLMTTEAINSWGLVDSFYSVNDPGCDYPTYAAPLGPVIRSRSTHKPYVIDKRRAYTLHSMSIALAWGFADEYLSEIPKLDGKTINELEVVSSLPRIAKSDNTGKSYLMDSGKRYYLSDSPDSSMSLRLFQGDRAISSAVFSAGLLTTITSGGALDYSFQSEGKWFVADYGTLRQIAGAEVSRWSPLLDGPTLGAALPSILRRTAPLKTGFQRDGAYYRVTSIGEVEATGSKNTARSWGVYTSPSVTHLLRTKITTASP